MVAFMSLVFASKRERQMSFIMSDIAKLSLSKLDFKDWALIIISPPLK